MFFKYFEGNYYVQYSRFRFRRSKARHPGDPAATGAKQSPETGRQSERQAERAAEVNNSAIELERPGTVPGLFWWRPPFWPPLQPVADAKELSYNELFIRQPGRQRCPSSFRQLHCSVSLFGRFPRWLSIPLSANNTAPKAAREKVACA